MSIFNKKTKELNFLREQNRKLIQRIEEKNKTITLYEDEIISLKKKLERLTPKRDKKGKFISKSNNKYQTPYMTISCDGNKTTIYAACGAKFDINNIISSIKSYCDTSFKRVKINIKNND